MKHLNPFNKFKLNENSSGSEDITLTSQELKPRTWIHWGDEKGMSVGQVLTEFQPQGAIKGKIKRKDLAGIYYKSGALSDPNEPSQEITITDDDTIIELELIKSAGRSIRKGDFINRDGWKEVKEVVEPGYRIKHKYSSDSVVVYHDDDILRPKRVIYKR
jgi:hypothetical protein